MCQKKRKVSLRSGKTEACLKRGKGLTIHVGIRKDSNKSKLSNRAEELANSRASGRGWGRGGGVTEAQI